jgi:hypothetical protein
MILEIEIAVIILNEDKVHPEEGQQEQEELEEQVKER